MFCVLWDTSNTLIKSCIYFCICSGYFSTVELIISNGNCLDNNKINDCCLVSDYRILKIWSSERHACLLFPCLVSGISGDSSRLSPLSPNENKISGRRISLLLLRTYTTIS